MKVMVCDCSPYLEALEGFRHVLREVSIQGKTFQTLDELDAERKKIDIPGLEPVYDEDSLEVKLRYMNSGRRFINYVRQLARLHDHLIDPREHRCPG